MSFSVFSIDQKYGKYEKNLGKSLSATAVIPVQFDQMFFIISEE